MQRLVLAGFIALALAGFPGLAGAAVIGSWNLEHLGWNNDKRLDRVVRVAGRFDLLAVQELMDDEALTRLERELEAVSGEDWSSMASHAVGRGRYREHYGFLWRPAASTSTPVPSPRWSSCRTSARPTPRPSWPVAPGRAAASSCASTASPPDASPTSATAAGCAAADSLRPTLCARAATR
ncbi:hypothetical protein [Halomonas sp. THAF12]|uniref:hypothetical protein n=1 Tax=Halomonas sp. THAF12 TaxID=2587849 RepID=UPI0020A5522B|nr:hypothetical protein [Halomonas sp. THAF12]